MEKTTKRQKQWQRDKTTIKRWNWPLKEMHNKTTTKTKEWLQRDKNNYKETQNNHEKTQNNQRETQTHTIEHHTRKDGGETHRQCWKTSSSMNKLRVRTHSHFMEPVSQTTAPFLCCIRGRFHHHWLSYFKTWSTTKQNFTVTRICHC